MLHNLCMGWKEEIAEAFGRAHKAKETPRIAHDTGIESGRLRQFKYKASMNPRDINALARWLQANGYLDASIPVTDGQGDNGARGPSELDPVRSEEHTSQLQ